MPVYLAIKHRALTRTGVPQKPSARRGYAAGLCAYRSWIDTVAIETGPFFCSVTRGGT